VAKNTQTYEQLAEIGANSDTRVAELVRFLAINLNVTPSMVENIPCEYMHVHSESSFKAKDTLSGVRDYSK